MSFVMQIFTLIQARIIRRIWRAFQQKNLRNFFENVNNEIFLTKKSPSLNTGQLCF